MKKSNIGAAMLLAGTIISFGGAVASTVAWYAYSTRIMLSLHGTAVSQTEQLQVGIKTDLTFPEDLVTQFKLTTLVDDGETYTFAAPGIGFDSSILKYYLDYSGYASDRLCAVTSNGYEHGDDLDLREGPIAYKPNRDIEALHSGYVYIPFAFRTVRINDSGELEYIQKQNIWITDVKCIADGGVGEVYKAVRVHIDGHKLNSSNEIVDNKFILNPSASSTSSRETVVAGLLNLDGDEYYDVDSGSIIENGNEIIYGKYNGTITSSLQGDEDTEIDDINNTGNDSLITTFTAKHRAKNYTFTSLEGLNPHKAKYKTQSDIKPTTDSNGFLTGGEVVCVTNETENAIGDLNMSIYIEGWDHSVIDQELDHSFYLGLTFEINRKA